MFFSITNSPATFQMMMNDLFKTFINEGVIVVYMDVIKGDFFLFLLLKRVIIL